MGNHNGHHNHHFYHHEDHTMKNEMKIAAQKFTHQELCVLKQTFKDLAHRSHGRSIQKETFLQYFPLPGLIGERLFAVFNRKKTGSIDYEEFICGLAVTCRGSFEDKTHFIFNLYDLDGDGTVSRSGLAALLNHVPSTVFKLMNTHLSGADVTDQDGIDTSQRYMRKAQSTDNMEPSIPENETSEAPAPLPADLYGEGGVGGDLEVDAISVSESADDSETDDEPHIDEFTNIKMVDQAFAEFELGADGRLTYEQFKTWVQHSPEVLEFLQSVFPFDETKDRVSSPSHSGSSRACRRGIPFQRTDSPFNHGRVPSPVPFLRSNSSPFPLHAMSDHPGGHTSHPLTSGSSLIGSRPGSSHGSVCSLSPDHAAGVGDGTPREDVEARRLLMEAKAAAKTRATRDSIESLLSQLDSKAKAQQNNNGLADMFKVEKEGYLWKIGHRIKMWRHRWYYLWDNCIYYYAHKDDVEPKGVMFISGCFVEPIHSQEYESKGHYGFKIIVNACSGEDEERLLFARTAEERDEWVAALRRACAVVPFEDYYELQEELGTGRFSRVFACRHRITQQRFAVKVIDKSTIAPNEKELLRTEIAILKLVRHPHIISMVEIYESRKHIRIVMELLEGGELFDRIVGRSRFSEDEARRVIKPLLESVAYLHELGIVHRDIKPENVLCGQRLCDIKIADFGLSKLVLPHQMMKMPCGTLSYVAPEVLSMQGYGKEADLWSVGVIMYLILRGKLPFDGKSKSEIIHKTINTELQLDSDPVWAALSTEVRQVVKILLSKDARFRTTCKEVLALPWFHHHHHHHHHHTGHCNHRRRHSRSGSESHTPRDSLTSASGRAPRPPSLATAATRVARERNGEFSPVSADCGRLSHGIVGAHHHHHGSISSGPALGGGGGVSPPDRHSGGGGMVNSSGQSSAIPEGAFSPTIPIAVQSGAQMAVPAVRATSASNPVMPLARPAPMAPATNYKGVFAVTSPETSRRRSRTSSFEKSAAAASGAHSTGPELEVATPPGSGGEGVVGRHSSGARSVGGVAAASAAFDEKPKPRRSRSRGDFLSFGRGSFSSSSSPHQ